MLDCIMWKSTYTLCGIKLEAGMEVIISGHPQVYPENGKFSIIVDTIELVGEGALKKAYDALQKKLAAEGLFDVSRKRKIPELVHRIGVITSSEGAVLSDFRNNLGKFGFKISLANSRVEGQAALKDLHAAFQVMKKQNIQVLVVIRGGGSLESLQAFNNEMLVREVVNFPVPVIAGIGHDKDVPLFALAADCMTSTPTAAAHVLNQSWEEAYAKLHQFTYLFARMTKEFGRIRADLDTSGSSMIDHTEARIKSLKERMAFAAQSIRLNDPTRQLKLGYSIVRQSGKIVKSIQDAKPGSKLDTQVGDGTIQSIVE